MEKLPPLLPARPLTLRGAYSARRLGGALLLGLAGAALAIGVTAWQLGHASQIRRDAELWENGALARWVDVRGQERTSKLIFHTYNLDVIYTLFGEARPRHAKVEFSSLGSRVNQRDPPQLRYDQRAPDRFVLSWAMSVKGGRWAEVAVLIGFYVLFGGLLLWAGRNVLLGYLAARAAAYQSDEIAVEILEQLEQSVNGRRTGKTIFRWRTTDEGPAAGGEAIFSRKSGMPLFVDAEKRLVLALRSPMAPTRPVLLREDLYPLAVDDAARKEVERRIAARRPA